MLDISLIAADASDAARLTALHSAAFAEGWSESALADLLNMPGAYALIAEDHDRNRDLGFALWRIAADEAEIVTLAVRSDARRRGVGKRLLLAMLALAAAGRARAMFLEVAESNAAARALYRFAEFAETGRRRNYYRNAKGQTEDALILRRDLPALSP